jgi:hypothetical protein
MRQRRIGPMRRVWVTPIAGAEPIASVLAERLDARPTRELVAA